MMAHSDDKLDKIWEKGAKVRGKKADLYRKDSEGKIIYKPSYGKSSNMGWEVEGWVVEPGDIYHINWSEDIDWAVEEGVQSGTSS